MVKSVCSSCGRKFISNEHMLRHAKEKHLQPPTGVPRSYGWATPYGFGDFTEPVIYEEACERMKQMREHIMKAKGWEI